jgi:hypothetical protein
MCFCSILPCIASTLVITWLQSLFFTILINRVLEENFCSVCRTLKSIMRYAACAIRKKKRHFRKFLARHTFSLCSYFIWLVLLFNSPYLFLSWNFDWPGSLQKGSFFDSSIWNTSTFRPVPMEVSKDFYSHLMMWHISKFAELAG